ncbi:MAG: discoidin domain-containing protein, partial [Dehalococcoidia bacterium]
ANIVDGDPDSYWATEDDIRGATLEIDLGQETYFDRIMLQEPIRFGQRISLFSLEARIGGEWTPIAEGTTIGYKRLFRIPGVSADGVRILIERANNVPAISNFGLFRASAGESAG